ncbi:MAG: M24 family metallopeptidase [Candidatus ainarchaeum sp.]|nr:M24 family metallopeptidase [Candidatus ainarchaeum sp.]
MNIPFLLYSGEETNANFIYFSGLGMKLYDHSFIFIDEKKKILIVSKMNYKLARENYSGKIEVYGDLKRILAKLLKGRKVGIDGENINVKMHNFIKKFCRTEDVSEELIKQRTVKKDFEITKLKKAAEISREIINSVELKKFKTEKEIEKYLLRETIEKELEPAFKPIVASGKNSSFPHYTPRDYKLKNVVLVDYGVKYQGYCGDVSRCFFLSKGPWEKDYETAEQIAYEIADESKNCEFAKELSEFTDKLYKKYKLPEQMHSLGHGIGLEVHESPSFGKKSKDRIKNTVFTIEPGIYRKNWGARFEEMFYFNGRSTKRL